MEYRETGSALYLRPGDDFDPDKIFACGQCFRWRPDGDGGYIGVAFGRALSLRREGEEILLRCSAEEFDEVWRGYFDLDRDYGAIRGRLGLDGFMREAVSFGAGLRILRQDPWETLCSFILSQCSNIPRISAMVERLCRAFGEPLSYEGRTYHAFPDPERIASLREEDLAPVRCGYRAGYVLAAARAVSSGALDLDAAGRMEPEAALSLLKTLPGVGDKVASCAALFGLGMLDAFPVDVWMRRAIREHYPGGLDPRRFSPWAGLAQQYIFYYARSGGKLQLFGKG